MPNGQGSHPFGAPNAVVWLHPGDELHCLLRQRNSAIGQLPHTRCKNPATILSSRDWEQGAAGQLPSFPTIGYVGLVCRELKLNSIWFSTSDLACTASVQTNSMHMSASKSYWIQLNFPSVSVQKMAYSLCSLWEVFHSIECAYCIPACDHLTGFYFPHSKWFHKICSATNHYPTWEFSHFTILFIS